jgi:hypothetical protein
MATKKKSSKKAPWKKPSPKKGKSKPLTSKQKSSARAKAKAKSRRYPNLVDNMNAAKKKKK